MARDPLDDNMLYGRPDDKTQVFRVVWRDPDPDHVYVIDIRNPKALPLLIDRSDLIDGLDSGRYVRIHEIRPISMLPEEAIPQHYKDSRMSRYARVRPMLEKYDRLLCDPSTRSKAVKELYAAQGGSMGHYYNLIRVWLQGGLCINAFIPLWENCGWRTDSHEHLLKEGQGSFGRKGKKAFRMTAEIADRLVSIAKKYFEENPNASFAQAYTHYLAKAFTETVLRPDGTLDEEVASPHPSFGQFCYRYRRRTGLKSRRRTSGGRRVKPNDYRDLRGRAQDLAFGPGSIYLIDWTLLDVYLRSSLSRNLCIGRSFLYLVVDVFSGMIVSAYLCLKNPSYAMATRALALAFSDQKVAHCQRYGVSITPDQWPCHGIPNDIWADRGELRGEKTNQLVNAFGFTMTNVPPYRGDYKAAVESAFNRMNIGLIHNLPGSLPDEREPGDRPCALDAKLTLEELTSLVLKTVVSELNLRTLPESRMDKDMALDGVPRIPLFRWQWGIENRSGHLRSLNPEQTEYSLWVPGTASLTGRGYVFEGIEYQSEVPGFSDLKRKARLDGSCRVPITYEPNDAGEIAVLCGTEYHSCRIDPKGPYALFIGRSRKEAAKELQRRKDKDREYGEYARIEAVKAAAFRDRIIQDAKKKTNTQIALAGRQPVASQLRGIGANREEQIAHDDLVSRQTKSIPQYHDDDVFERPVNYDKYAKEKTGSEGDT